VAAEPSELDASFLDEPTRESFRRAQALGDFED
jgi:hypothetical protein